MDDVIAATSRAFEALNPDKLADVFLTLQAVMLLILEHGGGNNFKLPHLGKQRMRNNDITPANLTCCASVRQAHDRIEELAAPHNLEFHF